MNELKVFENSEFGQVRTILKDGEPWFVATDVCKVLGHTNPTVALQMLDDDEKAKQSLGQVSANGVLQNRDSNIINEAGLYQLIIRSNVPGAKAFKRWITHEVIPAIRKTGGYIAGEESLTDDELLARALKVMQAKLEQREARIAGLTAENSKLTVSNQTMLPKAEYFDELVDRNLLTSFRETAKELKVKERAFVGFLLEKKYVYRDKKGKLMPYEAKNNGLFEIKECTNDKTAWSGTQTLITPKGRETFRLLTQGL